MHEQWQIEQGKRCGCKGSDEWCGCQNVRQAERQATRGGRFKGTPEQLSNALREAERRGGTVGAICGAAADEIKRLQSR